MARANRHYLPGYVWHITHRCHKKEFLLKFEKNKKRWMNWLFESKKRFGLIILNFIVTSNHIHLLVFDHKKDVISKSLQLIAGRTGREYNLRKNRKGAFWDDRYHATAVETGNHLIRCLVYIDLNMVRAGVVGHPSEWVYGGYNEIQNPKQRYSLIDHHKLFELLELKSVEQLQEYHHQWNETILVNGSNTRDKAWTESIAVGEKEFVLKAHDELGIMATGRKIVNQDGVYELRESQTPYSTLFDPKKCNLRPKNSYFWKVFADNTVW